MKSILSFFEIPATDFARATAFYRAILDIDIVEMEINGLQMGLFPGDPETVSGAVITGGGYQPSAQGVIVYLNGGDDLQQVLDKIEPNQGKVVVPKTAIGQDMGFYALFNDTEGNKIGLHSSH